MKEKWFILLLALAMFAFATGCGCGGDDDDDDSAPADDDTTDDDSTDDDTDDDTTDDDTTDDDTTDDDVDDDTDDDADVEYDSLVCETAEPAGVGGGAITSSITVYVYDDLSCDPIQNATVILNDGDATETTDADGMAELTIVDAAQTVTATASGCWSWSYKADANTMVFRLKCNSTASYTDSAPGDFTEGGSPLGLTNPSLLQLFTTPVSLGVALPGVSRESILYTDFYGLLAGSTFDLTLDTGSGPEVTEIPANVYLPNLNLSVPGVFSASGVNNQYVVPVNDDATESPIEGFVIQVLVSSILGDLGAILDLIDCVGSEPNILTCIGPLVTPLINDGVSFSYAGAVPDWNGTGAPDIEVYDTQAKAELDIDLTHADSDYDYLAILAAEIPNRALLPLGIGIIDSGSTAVDYADIPNADYMAVLGATDLLKSGFTSANFSFAIKYAESIDDFTGGVSFDGDEFLPAFDSANCSWDESTSTIEWALESGDTPDLYQIIYVPDDASCESLLAQVPGSDTSFVVPADACANPSAADIVVVIGAAMPGGFDGNNYNPLDVMSFDIAGVNLWTNLDLSGLF